jgi:hypothetical protein
MALQAKFHDVNVFMLGIKKLQMYHLRGRDKGERERVKPSSPLFGETVLPFPLPP